MISTAFVVAAFASGTAVHGQVDAPGAMLVTGMRLVYASQGAEQVPWVVESVERPVTIGEQSNCARIRLRISPAGEPELREWCTMAGLIHAWDATRGNFRPLRPIVAMRRLDLPSGSRRSRYETEAAVADTIDGVIIAVIPTTVTTIDSAGNAIRRLRERYAPALATATRGIFEVPDSTPGSWRVQQEFRLVAIRR